MHLSSRHPIHSAPAITAVILGAGIFAPSQARAECGNYIVYASPAHRPADDPPMGEHRMPVGCHGPNCSKVPPAAPMPQVPPSVRILGDVSLVTQDGHSLVPPSAHAFPFDPSSGDVICRPTDVFHPPR